MIKHGLIAAALISGLIQPALAALERYEVDPNHTYPSIEFSHMGISFWRGKFNKTSGAITIDRAAGTGEVEIVVDTSTINFGLAAMDEKARSEDFFDVARFPTAVYRGTLDLVEGKPRTVDGRVTIHVQLHRSSDAPEGSVRCRCRGRAQLVGLRNENEPLRRRQRRKSPPAHPGRGAQA